MKSIIETGTDAAMVCFFDRQSLPPDFDQISADDPIALLDQLEAQQLLWFGGDGDGTYTFHVYLDEPAPEPIVAHGEVIKRFERFQVPSGELWFCGVEYMANDPVKGSTNTPPGGLEIYEAAGERITLTAGNYEVTVYRCEWSDQELSDVVKQAIPASLRTTYRIEQALQILAGGSLVIGAIALFFSAFMCVALTCITAFNWFFRPDLLSRLPVVLGVWGPIALGGAASLTLGWWILRSLKGSKVGPLADAARRELPEFAVVLKPA